MRDEQYDLDVSSRIDEHTETVSESPCQKAMEICRLKWGSLIGFMKIRVSAVQENTSIFLFSRKN